MKKFICILLVGIMLSACSPGTQEDTASTISVSVIDRNLIPLDEGTYSNNRWTKWVNENSPVKVDWIPIGQNNFEQALNIMFNANTAPDLIVNESRNLMQTLADKKLIQPVDSYIDEYSIEYSQYIKEHEHFRLYTTLNRQTYLFTSESEAVADSAIWIRKDWLDTLGMEIPGNTEELLEVARAFTYSDPDKNNINDTVGIVSTTDMIEQLFMVDQQWYADESGKIYISQLTDRYISMLLYKRQLFSEGIIDNSFILGNNSRLQLWLDGKCGILFSDWNANNFRSLLKDNSSAVIVPLESVATDYGDNGIRHKPPVGHYVAFNSNMDSPENGIKFLDWMISDGYQTLSYGIEGQHYENEYGNIKPIDVEKNNAELNYATFDMPILRKGTISPEKILNCAANDNVLDQTIAQLNAQSLSISLNNPRKQNIPIDISANVAKIKHFETEWSIFVKDIESEFILSELTSSPMSGDTLKATLSNEWNRLNGNNIQRLMQQWYDENKYSFIYKLAETTP